MARSTLVPFAVATFLSVVSVSAASAAPAAPRVVAREPDPRTAAQRGLTFLARETLAWQRQNRCFGCHVQGVTMEALAVGLHNQYDVARPDVAEILAGMLDGSGALHHPRGFSHQESHFFGTANAFGGNALARYDQWVSGQNRADLLAVAAHLEKLQAEDGNIETDYGPSAPVVVGDAQRVYQAAQTWRQAHARSADERWLSPIRRAESWLRRRAQALAAPPAAGQVASFDLQETNYVLMGMAAAGVSPAQDVMRALTAAVLERQNQDGGWALGARGTSHPLATGQTLYTLRVLGRTEVDSPVYRGTRWLIAHQQPDGGWSHGGSSKGEGMWAVLGLVSVDLVTVAVTGLEDGERAEGVRVLKVSARDNSPGGRGVVKELVVAVDDVPVHRVKGGELSYALDAGKLAAGPHVVDVIATNGAGARSRRRLEVYAGDVFVADVATRSTERETEVSLRSFASAGDIELAVFALDGAGKPRAEAAARLVRPARPGPMTLTWDGKGADGKSAPAGRYLARVSYRRPASASAAAAGGGGKTGAGTVAQTAETSFVRDTTDRQQAAYAQVQGVVALPSRASSAGAPAAAARTRVDLVDDRGNVVQSVMSTAEGQYRFRGVSGGKYKVRVAKDGFVADERPVEAKAGREEAADVALH